MKDEKLKDRMQVSRENTSVVGEILKAYDKPSLPTVWFGFGNCKGVSVLSRKR